MIAVIDRSGTFYPPAVAALGIALQQVMIIQPKDSADTLWAIDQALRCPAIAAVIASLSELTPRDARRLQLAAETGHSLGLLLRPLTARGKPSWAHVQLYIQPLPSSADVLNEPTVEPVYGSTSQQWRVELLRCPGIHSPASFTVEYDWIHRIFITDDSHPTLTSDVHHHESTLPTQHTAPAPPSEPPCPATGDCVSVPSSGPIATSEADTVPLAAQLAHPTTMGRTASSQAKARDRL